MADSASGRRHEQLSTLQYAVTREGATEPAFSGDYLYHNESGRYRCVCCDAVLFDSGTKYDSGSGWPSFWRPASDAAVRRLGAVRPGVRRTELRCAACNAHLGHVYEDGPQPTGERYCINSAALVFSTCGA